MDMINRIKKGRRDEYASDFLDKGDAVRHVNARRRGILV